MNCQNIETVLHEVARDQIMESGKRDDALAHVASCAGCALKLDAERALTKSLGELRVAMASISAPERIEERLLAQFRSEQSSGINSISSSWKRYGIYAAIAATLLVVMGVAIILSTVQVPSSAGQAAASPSTSVTEVTKDTVVASAGPAIKNVRESSGTATKPGRVTSLANVSSSKSRPSQRVRPMRKPATVPVSPSSEEVATDFLPIGYSSLANVQDGGQVVRVALPRWAMARFGLPVNMDRYDESVKADVLVSADGLARAIRFVQ